MIVVRTLLHAKFGQGGELARRFAEGNRRIMEELGISRGMRIMTDLSGRFDTVAMEIEAESLAEWEQVRTRLFATKAFQDVAATTYGMVESGSTEFWTVEADL